MRTRIFLGLLLGTLLGACDSVRIGNSAGAEHGLLLDGFTEGTHANDKAFVSAATSIDVGVVGDSLVSNEVIGFTRGRPVALEPTAGWTAMTDRIDLSFADEIAVEVMVWIVRGPFAQQRDLALDASLTTSVTWDSERMGVRFAQFSIRDATADPQAAAYSDFTCSDREALQTDIGRTAGQINVYYVDRVRGSVGRGSACAIGGDFVAMGRVTGDELLVHEFGHNFGLTHIDTLRSSFDATNVMYSASNRRAFFTEGQLFRAHLHFNSALNAVYDARPGQPRRECQRDEATPFCPRIATRLWPDGLFRDPGGPPVIGAPAPGAAAPPAATTLAPLELAREWLATTCTTGEDSGMPPQLIERAAQVEPFFLAILERGPDDEMTREHAAAARARFRARAVHLAAEKNVGLSPADYERARGRGEEEFLARAQRDFELRSRTQAAAALAFVGSEAGARALALYAADIESPLQQAAQESLATLRIRTGQGSP